jgi:DNA repair protein RadC
MLILFLSHRNSFILKLLFHFFSLFFPKKPLPLRSVLLFFNGGWMWMRKSRKSKTGIGAWAEADRPREKLILHGRRSLSNAELIAILIRVGNNQQSAVDLGRLILKSFGNDLMLLSKLNVSELSKFHGMGEAKSIAVIAALELGRRKRAYSVDQVQKIKSAKDADYAIRPELADLAHEEFWILLLSRSNIVIGKHLISKGGLSATVVDPKIIFKIALEHHASSIILAHNHPSGSLMPSSADLSITKKLVAAGKILEIPVVDHLIIGDNGFMSFADESMMKD